VAALDPALLCRIVREHGTPCYVYDADAIRQRIARLRSFDVIRYAQKASSNVHLLRLVREEDVLVDAVSGGELERALRAGYVHNDEASPPQSVTPILFEAPRDQVTLGATVPLARRVTLDVGYIHLGQDDRRGRVRGPRPGEEPTVELDGGVFRLDAHLFGADVRFRL